MVLGLIRHEKLLFGIPAKGRLGQLDLVGAERGSVGFGRTGLVGRSTSNGGVDHDQRRARVGLGGGNGLVDAVDVGVAAVDLLYVPTVGLEAFAHVFAEVQRGGTVERDLVVVVQPDQLAQLEVTGQRGGLVGDAFHHVAVADQRIGSVVDDGVSWPVVAAGQKTFCHGHADGIGRALPERSSGGFDARRAQRLGVARGARAPSTRKPWASTWWSRSSRKPPTWAITPCQARSWSPR